MKQNIKLSQHTIQGLHTRIRILKFLLNERLQDHHQVRQKTIVDHFQGKLSRVTVARQCHNLVRSGVLEQDPSFEGTYIVNINEYQQLEGQIATAVLESLPVDIKDLVVEYIRNRGY